MDGTMRMALADINYHRNGPDGSGFWVILFHWLDDGNRERIMVATVFPEPGHIAVLDVMELWQRNIHPGRDASFRADHFEPTLRDWVESYRSLGNPQRPAV